MPTVSVATFPGVNLSEDPQQDAGALDLLNVVFDKHGRVGTRQGYAQFVAKPSAGTGFNRPIMPFIRSAVTGIQILSGSNDGGATNVTRVYDEAGALVSSTAGAFNNPVRYGSGTTERVYFYLGSALERWDGAAFAAVAGAPAIGPLVVSPIDNRLVNAVGSKVSFSDAGDPETWGANNYVNVTPNDGETVPYLATFKNQVFAFKQSRFFVFYGTSTDSTGNPVFNYRPVDTTVGPIVATNGASSVVTTRNGVYFVGKDGIYRTTGGPPEKLSTSLDAIFWGDSPATFASGGAVTGCTGSGAANGHVYFTVSSGLSAITLDFHEWSGQWSLHNFPMGLSASVRRSTDTVDELYFNGGTTGFVAAAGKLLRLTKTATDDAGTAIASRYRTGFMDLGVPEQEKWLRSMMLSGTGTVNVKTAVNDAATLSSAVSVAMGTSPAVGTGRWGAGTRGRNISVDISATSGQWSLSHLSLDIGATRPAGVRAA